MPHNKRLFEIYDYLKKNNQISTYVELAGLLNTNKSGINDLKIGKKKVSVEIIESMKKSYPLINLDWWIMGTGEMILTYGLNMVAEEPVKYNVGKPDTVEALQKLVKAQEKTIDALETIIATKSPPNNTNDPVRAIQR